MFLVLLLLFLVARFASAQTGAEIAYDLFDYTGTTDLASNGGHGFAAKWTATGRCIVQPFSPPQSPNFTSFAKKIQIGSNRKDPDEAWICELQRPFAMQFSAADTTVRFVSFLLSSEKSVSRDSMFGVALGTLTYLDWEVGVDYLELRRRGNPPFAFMVTHDMSSSGIGSVQTRFEYNMKEIETPRQSARGDHFLVVMKITPISGPIGEKDFDLQLYVYEADYLNNVNASLLDAAPPQRVDPFASSMSIAMLGFFVSQVRAGTTFGSVYTATDDNWTTAQLANALNNNRSRLHFTSSFKCKYYHIKCECNCKNSNINNSMRNRLDRNMLIVSGECRMQMVFDNGGIKINSWTLRREQH
jgi:hypothetical protein